MTEVITLQPGADQTRRDWSPIAQPPDRHDVIAHTPDPKSYHRVGGRTMIPRSMGGKDRGASRGFSVRPGVLNIDPTDPVAGTGGITVDVEQVSKEGYIAASSRADGNPVAAWAMAGQMQKQGQALPTQPQQPQQAAVQPAMVQAVAGPQLTPGGNYVTPHTDPSGGIIPMPDGASTPWQQQAASPVQGLTGSIAPLMATPAMVSPAVKPREDPMTVPQAMPESWANSQPAVPLPQQPSQPVASQGIQMAQPMPQQPAPQLMQQPAAFPVTQPQSVSPSQPADQSMMMQQLMQQWQQQFGMLMLRLEQMEANQRPAATASQASPNSESANWEDTKKAAIAAEREEEQRKLALPASPYDAIGLPFLTSEPDRPRVQVIFELPNGMQRTRYHHVSRRGMCLSLISDSRYDGDQFIPSPTLDGQPITVKIPDLELEVLVDVFDFHNTIGCMDVLNLVIRNPPAQPGPPVMPEYAQQEIETLGGQVPTQY